MKKIITTLSLAIIMVAGTNAQIKKPTVTVNSNKFNLETVLDKGIKIDLKNIKSLKDLDRLNIPVTEYTKSQVDARALRTWKITPMRAQYGALKLLHFVGEFGPSSWYGLVPYRDRDRFLPDLQEGIALGFSTMTPIILSFTPTQNAVYILKIPFRKRGDGTPYRGLHYIGTPNNIQLVTPVEGTLYYYFSAGSSQPISICITGEVFRSRTNGEMTTGAILTDQFQIDQIN